MIDADRENRGIRDGEVVTACQQVCPTGAIVFGNVNDANSQVADRKKSPLDYRMLEDLNTRPRTSYEALIRNFKPGFEKHKPRPSFHVERHVMAFEFFYWPDLQGRGEFVPPCA